MYDRPTGQGRYIRTSERRGVAASDYRQHSHMGAVTNRTRIELLDRKRSESKVGGLRHSYDSAPTIPTRGQGSGYEAAQHQEVKKREAKSRQE